MDANANLVALARTLIQLVANPKASDQELINALRTVNAPLHVADDGWLDTPGAARHTGFAQISLEIMRHEGRGPKYFKTNRRVRYKRSDLDAWLMSAPGPHAVSVTRPTKAPKKPAVRPTQKGGPK